MNQIAASARNKSFLLRYWRWLLLAALVMLVYFGGEALAPLLEEGTHLLLETMEMLIEEFYEHVLHLPRREAEIVTVWSGTFMGLVLLYYVVRAIINRIVLAYLAARDWYLSTLAALIAWRKTWSEADIAILTAAAAVVAITVLMLFF